MAGPLSTGRRASRSVNWFFDSAAVIAATTKAERRVLSRQGAFVRRTARGSLKYPSAKVVASKITASKPGQPPTVYKTVNRRKVNKKTGKVTVSRVSPLREFLFFSYDPASRSVVVGPAKVSGVSGRAPRTLEFGGRVPGKSGKTQAPRPFMGPALAVNKPKFAGMWKNQVRA